MQKITPCLWFDRVAEEAVNYYLGIFPGSKIINTTHYPNEGLADFQKEFSGKVLTVEFEIFGQRYVALNAGSGFKFNESISIMVACKDQDEIDYYWNALTKDGGEESVCGWLKDKYGLSWQVAPHNFDQIILSNPASFQKMMTMKKIILAEFN